jgi:hypothetical protein
MANIIVKVDIYLANKKNLAGIKIDIQVGFQAGMSIFA